MDEISSDQLLDSLFDGVYFVDANRCITYWNNGAERITGYNKAEVIGSCCANNILRHIDIEGRELCLDGCPLAETIMDGKSRETNVFLHHKLGHRVPVSVRTSPVRDNQGAIIGAVEIFCDNSSSMLILHEYEKLKQEAYMDALTGVGNRRYGEITLSTRIYDWNTHSIPFGVLFLDIDHFKLFNDIYGHKTGDDVLLMVGKSISVLLRKMDVVSRWGGEEFVVILPGASKVVVKSVSERIRVLVENSFIMEGDDKLKVTVSIGATMSREGDSAETVIKRADRLMYLSKAAGRNRISED
jgi:diguanylate cyclase (GGDEF)-like protein/PAS domain S-box-containing protein